MNENQIKAKEKKLCKQLMDHFRKNYCNCADCSDRLHTLAWIAHCCGIRVKQSAEFMQVLSYYEGECTETSPHQRN